MEKGLERIMRDLISVLESAEPLSLVLYHFGNISAGFLFVSLIVAVIVSGITGYLIGVGKLLGGFPASLKAALFNMDNYVFTGSLIVLIFSIYISAVDEGNTAAIIMLNIFSSVIFSWLLTKKTSIKDFKEKEEELALRSYRHINYIESAANTASGTIDKYISEHSDISAEVKLILANAKEQIKYVQGGINTCKMDWFDLLSTEEKGKRKKDEDADGDFGTVDIVISDAEINQEDA